jgi:transposase
VCPHFPAPQLNRNPLTSHITGPTPLVCPSTAECGLAARRHVGELLDINPGTIRNWVEAEERATGSAGPDADVSADAAAELRRLRAENAELRRANEILKTASAFFAQAELDRRLK